MIQAEAKFDLHILIKNITSPKVTNQFKYICYLYFHNVNLKEGEYIALLLFTFYFYF